MTAYEVCALIATGSCCVVPWCVLIVGALLATDPGRRK